MHRNARGLVHDDEISVFKDDRVANEIAQRLGGCFGFARLQSYGWYSHPIARCETVIRTDTLTIHADFAATQDPVNQASRSIFQNSQKEVVDALAIISLASLDVAHFRLVRSLRVLANDG